MKWVGTLLYDFLQRVARNATIGAEGCPIGVQVELLELNLNCRWRFELSSDAAGGWKALPGGVGYPRNEGGGETRQVSLVEDYVMDYNVKSH